MNKPREQLELFSDEEIFNEWDNGTWICDCPKIQTDLFHCDDCQAEPPGGCQCLECADLSTSWESENK